MLLLDCFIQFILNSVLVLFLFLSLLCILDFRLADVFVTYFTYPMDALNWYLFV
jgi:hypothetical protein